MTLGELTLSRRLPYLLGRLVVKSGIMRTMRRNIRNLIIVVVLILGVALILTKFEEVQAVAETLKKGDWRFVFLALGVEIVWIFNIAASYRSIYQAMGLEERLEKLFFLSIAAEFVNVVAPSGGMGGVAVFVAEARRKGYSTARVTVAGVLFLLFDYAGFSVILASGLFVLLRRNNLNSAEIIASLILLAIIIFLVVMMILGMRSERELGTALAWMAHLVNRMMRPLIHRDYLSELHAYEFAHDAASGLHLLRCQPRKLIGPFLLGLSSKVLHVAVLMLIFLAFKVPFTMGTLIAGYSIAYLFLIVSPTPSGMGIVEGILTLALASLAVPLGTSAVLALAYRGITFWLPILAGMMSFRWLLAHKEVDPV